MPINNNFQCISIKFSNRLMCVEKNGSGGGKSTPVGIFKTILTFEPCTIAINTWAHAIKITVWLKCRQIFNHKTWESLAPTHMRLCLSDIMSLGTQGEKEKYFICTQTHTHQTKKQWNHWRWWQEWVSEWRMIFISLSCACVCVRHESSS